MAIPIPGDDYSPCQENSPWQQEVGKQWLFPVVAGSSGDRRVCVFLLWQRQVNYYWSRHNNDNDLFVSSCWIYGRSKMPLTENLLSIDGR